MPYVAREPNRCYCHPSSRAHIACWWLETVRATPELVETSPPFHETTHPSGRAGSEVSFY